MCLSRLHLFKLKFFYSRYITDTGEPIRCVACESTDLDDEIKETVANHPAEKDRICKCGQNLGFWAYGYWLKPAPVTWSKVLSPK